MSNFQFVCSEKWEKRKEHKAKSPTGWVWTENLLHKDLPKEP